MKRQLEIIEQIQDELTCCITLTLIKTPVVTVTGHTFQEKAIKRWFKNSMKSPLTGEYFQSQTTIDNSLIRKTIKSYSNQLKLLLIQTKYYHDLYKDQASLIDSQIQNLLQQPYQNLNKQNIMYNNYKQNDQFYFKKRMLKQQLIKSQQNKNNKCQSISMILSNVITNLTIQQIQDHLENNLIFSQFSKQQSLQIKQGYNQVNISQNLHQLVFRKYQIDFDVLVKTNFEKVQMISFWTIKINHQQFKLFLLNINKTLPNLKIIRICYCFFILADCQLNHTQWKLMIQHIDELINIQVLDLYKNQIQSINQQDLQTLLKMKQLKFIDLRQNQLTNQSEFLLEQFQQNNQQIQLYFTIVEE